MLLWLYRFLYPFALLAGAPFYLRRMWRRGGYVKGFAQRFGGVALLPPKRADVQRIWLQAVSVGELLAVAPLLEAWASEGHEVYLTTTTSTGHALARERYAKLTIGIGYFPLDWWPFSARAWSAVPPDVAVLMEGERWPEHIAQAARHGVPVVCLNARLSDRSFRRMQRLRWAVRPLLGGISQILACSEEDARRFRALGFAPERIAVTGNIKLDVAVPTLSAGECAQLRADLGFRENGLILMGASTWPGEEAALIAALKRARAAGIRCSLLLVPRHAERRDELVDLLRESGLSYRVRSEWLGESNSGMSQSAESGVVRPQKETVRDCVDLAFADTTGELQGLLQVADLVFVGKSLPPHTEGQTPVESAILGRPILFGPGMGNFRQIARELVSFGAARRIATAEALAAEVCALLGEGGAAERAQMGAAGRAWHAQNAGALSRSLDHLRHISRRS